jgi:hypothetical protein
VLVGEGGGGGVGPQSSSMVSDNGRHGWEGGVWQSTVQKRRARVMGVRSCERGKTIGVR